MSRADMPFDDVRWDVEMLRVLGVHHDPVHQLVLVGEVLIV